MVHRSVLADHRRSEVDIGTWEAILLGLVQGLTEFLPVSSSGHLVLAQKLLGTRQANDLTFEVMVHFGTALSILTVFRRQVWALALSPFLSLRDRKGSAELTQAGYLLLATVPAGLAGLLFKDAIEAAFLSVPRVSAALIVTGGILWCTRYLSEGERALDAPRSFAVGLAQALAILPGISRSGSTTCVALYLGVPREQAAAFSMLMAIPVILGATALQLRKLMSGPLPTDTWAPLLAGTVVAYASGCVAILAFLAAVRRGRLDLFGVYCTLAGTIGLVASWFYLT
jgi:undecaprenyl-diphosphatase